MGSNPTLSASTLRLAYTSECNDGPQFDVPSGEVTTYFCSHHTYFPEDEEHNDPTLFITRTDGKNFSLMSFDVIYNDGTWIGSSKGQRLFDEITFPGSDNFPLHYDLSEDNLFTNVKWVSILTTNFFGHETAAFANMRFQSVDAPGTALLVVADLFFLPSRAESVARSSQPFISSWLNCVPR